jgi:hypothetical protein
MLFGNVKFGGESPRDLIEKGKGFCFTMPYFLDWTGVWDL